MENNTYSLSLRYIGKVLRTMQYGDPLPMLPEKLSWRNIFKVSRDHSLSGTLWYFVSDLVKKDCADTDTELIELWERERSIAFAQNLVQTAEFTRLTDAFTREKIKFLPLKGFIFKKLWRKYEYRTMADMDFYVGEEGIEAVTKKLTAIGYKLDHGGAVHDSFVKPPYLNIEVHKILRLDSADTFENWHAKVDNPYWYEMGEVDFMLFNVAHIYKHYKTGGCGARSLFDLQLYIEQNPDIVNNSLLLERLKNEDMLDFYHDLLHLMHFWYGDGTVKEYASDTDLLLGGEPSEKLCEMEYYIATGGAYGSLSNQVEYHRARQSKFGYYLGRLFLPYKNMCDCYPWLKKMPILLPVAYVIRIFKAIFNGRLRNELKLVKRAEKKMAQKKENQK